MRRHVAPLLVLCSLLASCKAEAPSAPPAPSPASASVELLPSWNDGAAKKAIVDFVSKTTRQGDADFVPAAERIAVFDNDGTLWSEQPMYFQLAFALDRVKALAPKHPEWKTTQPFKGVLDGDLKAVLATGEKGLMQIVTVSHAGNTTEEFDAIVREWITTARHPTTKRPYNEMVYKPMLDVLTYLRANGYKTYIVSGGGVEFMRPWVERTYGIPPEQVVGSRARVKYEVRDGMPVLLRLPEIDSSTTKPGSLSASIR